jgi:glycosyltransferase involved in cell wall biosynthesis
LLFVIRLLAGRTGGAERVFCTLANALTAQGYQVTIAYCEGRKDPIAFRLSEGITVLNLWDPKKRALPRYSRFKRWSEKRLPFGLHHLFAWFTKYLPFVTSLRQLIHKTKPSLVISFLPSANTPALLACLGTKTKLLCTNHGVPASDFDSKERWDQNPVDRFLRRKLLFRANGLTVLFPSYISYFGKALSSRVHAIANFLDDSFFIRDASVKTQKQIIASGRLTWEKNFFVLVDAFAQVATRNEDFELLIYGEGPERKNLEEQIAKLGLNARVKLPGHEPNIIGRLREAYAFCHPAHFEGFGLSAAEALAQGLPVVIFGDCSGVNEYVLHNVNGLFVERSEGAEGLAQALLQLIEDLPLRNRLSHAASASVLKFRADIILAQWQVVIESLAKD